VSANVQIQPQLNRSLRFESKMKSSTTVNSERKFATEKELMLRA